jgi:hypothetical protein
MGWSKPKVDTPKDTRPAALVGYAWHLERRTGTWSQAQVDYLALGDRVVNADWKDAK